MVCYDLTRDVLLLLLVALAWRGIGIIRVVSSGSRNNSSLII